LLHPRAILNHVAWEIIRQVDLFKFISPKSHDTIFVSFFYLSRFNNIILPEIPEILAFVTRAGPSFSYFSLPIHREAAFVIK